MVEVRACSTVAVPVVVVEGESLLAACVVIQDDAWARGGGIASVYLYELGLGLSEMRDRGSYMYRC